MKLCLAGVLSILCLPLLHGASTPNVIIIYGDDVGYADVGAYGAKLIPTPHLDKMSAEGLRFTDGHCAAATCTPSRYSMLTGSMAFRKSGTGILRGNAKMAISPDQFTLPDLFKKAGYTTGVIGKWHLGLGMGEIDWNGDVKPGPLELGFDSSFLLPSTNDRVPSVYLDGYRVPNLDPNDPITVSYGKKIPDDVPGTTYPDAKVNPEAMTYYRSSHGHNNTVINGIGRIGYMKGGKSALFNDEDITDVLVGKTREFIKANKDKPFFLFYSSQDIHVPRTPHKRFQGKTKLGYRGDAMVALDWVVGEVMASLKENGVDENTMVIFSSDNGPVYDDGYNDGTKVKTSSQEVDQGHDGSGPYRGGKYQIYEGGTRVPVIVRWPGGMKPGVSDALVTQVDFLKSFAEWFKLPVPAGHAIDSRSVLGALLGKSDTGAEIILEQAKGVALRKGPWKYIGGQAWKNGKGPKGQLYNLDTDIGEKNNVATANPKIAAELAALHAKYTKQGLAE